MKRGTLENLGMPVTDMTLGIIGMGRIGKALCKRARACGREVSYQNRRPTVGIDKLHAAGAGTATSHFIISPGRLFVGRVLGGTRGGEGVDSHVVRLADRDGGSLGTHL